MRLQGVTGCVEVVAEHTSIAFLSRAHTATHTTPSLHLIQPPSNHHQPPHFKTDQRVETPAKMPWPCATAAWLRSWRLFDSLHEQVLRSWSSQVLRSAVASMRGAALSPDPYWQRVRGCRAKQR